MRNDNSVVILGAGIHGLAAALVLTETRGFGAVKIYSREPVGATTSTVAGGLIEPAFITEGDTRINAWFSKSRARFADMLRDPRWYVRRGSVRTFWRSDKNDPAWAPLVDDFASAAIDHPPHVRTWSYTTEIVETPHHLAELARHVQARGVQIVQREVTALAELTSEAAIVINCSGVGARQLGDTSVAPARGQVIVLQRSESIPDEVVVDDGMLTYIIPRLTDVIVGGTYGMDDWSRDPRPEVAADIMERAMRLVPQIKDAVVLGHRAGLRPVRDPVPRLELEPIGSGRIVAHCYGTGGAGITLSYGMAEDLVAQLARTMAA